MFKHETKELYGVIPTELQNKLWDMMLGIEFDWHHLADTTYVNPTTPGKETPGFAHLLFNRDTSHKSQYFEDFEPILLNTVKKLDVEMTQLIRMRLGFLLNTKYAWPSDPYLYNEPHVDFEEDHVTALYYFNENDGNTFIFDNDEPLDPANNTARWKIHKECVPDVVGKTVAFDGRRYHASTCPKMKERRIVLTMNFKTTIDE